MRGSEAPLDFMKGAIINVRIRYVTAKKELRNGSPLN